MAENDDDAVPKCSTNDCPNKASSLKCPTCSQQGLPDCFFCSQECFKSSWKQHKKVHICKPVTASVPVKWEPPPFDWTGPLRPAQVTPMKPYPSHIQKPDYAETSIPESEKKARKQTNIEIKTPEQIEAMRLVCRYTREVLDVGARVAGVGVTTDEIDKAVQKAAIERNCYASSLNYYRFPKSCCTSVNEVICHGIPDLRPLQDGDLLKLDVSLFHGGFHGDMCETFTIGNCPENAVKLANVSYECLMQSIAAVKPGAMYREFGNIITKHASASGLSVVKTYCGHGIGELFHTTPTIPHYSKNKAPGLVKPGHTFTIEPMISEGTWQDRTWPDDWSAVTRDGKLSAQFEHTLLATEDGVEILTARLPDSFLPGKSIGETP